MTESAPGRTTARLVVADDDPDIREIVVFKLEAAGYEVTATEDGRAALEAIRRLKPDLAVLDVMMPGLTGFEVLEAVRADESLKGTRVLLLTARAHEESVERGLQAGADDYVVKPFSPRELALRVETLLARGSR
jgi:DNA-binding response OmpR family regulator